MPRPHKMRSVHCPPAITDFKPAGIRGRDLRTIELALDEYEAIRLADHQGLDHAESAMQMGISRSTFSRLVEKARRKVAGFIVTGQRLRIGGGEIHFAGNLLECRQCGRRFKVAFGETLERCPDCGPVEFIDHADGYGHGSCCRRHHRAEGR